MIGVTIGYRAFIIYTSNSDLPVLHAAHSCPQTHPPYNQ